MRAITLWNPWAALMAAGAKRIETRSRWTNIHEDIAICAAKGWNKECHEAMKREDVQNALAPLYSGGQLRVNSWNLPAGKVVAVVKLYRCLASEVALADFFRCDGLLTDKEMAFGNYGRGRFVWLTNGLRRLERPVDVIGRQFIFKLPPDVEAKVVAQL